MKITGLVVVIAFITFSQNVMAQPVHICDDEGEWAPYAYHPRVDGIPNKSKIAGYTVDLLDEISKIVGLEIVFEYTNWKRCLKYVELFDKSNKYEAFVNGAFSIERAKIYYITTAIYSTHEGVFYSKNKYPNGLPLRQSSDMDKFKICAIYGHDYSDFSDKYGVPADTKIDQRAKNTVQVLNMVSKGRCDIFQSSIEPIYGGVAIGQYEIPDDIASMPIPNVKNASFHIFISKRSPRAYELLAKFNQAILILQNNGVSQRLLEKYIPPTL